MDLGLKVISFLSGAARSNLYGLACPFYCTQPSIALVLLAFVIGTILGAGLTALILWNLTFAPAPPSPRVLTRRSALAGYLHARVPSEQRRWDWTSLLYRLPSSRHPRPFWPGYPLASTYHLPACSCCLSWLFCWLWICWTCSIHSCSYSDSDFTCPCSVSWIHWNSCWDWGLFSTLPSRSLGGF